MRQLYGLYKLAAPSDSIWMQIARFARTESWYYGLVRSCSERCLSRARMVHLLYELLTSWRFSVRVRNFKWKQKDWTFQVNKKSSAKKIIQIVLTERQEYSLRTLYGGLHIFIWNASDAAKERLLLSSHSFKKNSRGKINREKEQNWERKKNETRWRIT